MLHKIYSELLAIRQEISAVRNCLEKVNKSTEEKKGHVTITTDYANNQPCCEVLEISLPHHDWCKLRRQPCYRDLMLFLESLQIQGKIDIP